MRALVTGNIGYLSAEWLKQALPGYRVLLAGDTPLKNDWEKGISVIPSKDIDYSQLLSTYDFDYILVFSNRLSFQSQEQGEMERLRALLDACKEHAPVRLIYLDGPCFEQPDPISQAAIHLCSSVANDELQIQILQCLYLYSGAWKKDYFYRLFSALDRKGTFDFRVSAGQSACFMAMDDLSLLIHRMTEEWPQSNGIFHVPDCFGHTFADLETALKKAHPSWRFSYRSQEAIQSVRPDDRALRTRFGWFPRYCVFHDLEQIENQYQQAKPAKIPLADRLSRWKSHHRKLFMLLELLVAVLLTVLCGYLSNWQVQFSLIDFRLLLIILMGTIYGMNMGLLAAFVASIMLLVSYQAQGSNWLTLFYDPTNWIVFIAYFVVGAACGYLRLIDKDKVRFAQEENEQLKEKLIFTQNMYHDVLHDKREYKKQIIGSKDSFGKIFSITQQLNVTHEKEVFIQAVDILEKIMENQTIALYSVTDESHYGRLMAASRQIGVSLPVSITMDSYQEILPIIETGEVFTNTRMLENYPMYAAGIRHEGKLKMLVTIQEANYDQMSLYYMNLFKILCGLIGSALTHTMEYQETLREKQCFPGTHILTEEHFEKKLELERKMGEQKIAMHLLLQLDHQGKSLQEMDQLLVSRVRTCDTIGIARDGKMYLILAQATMQALPIIQKRLLQVGIQCRQINLEEMK